MASPMRFFILRGPRGKNELEPDSRRSIIFCGHLPAFFDKSPKKIINYKTFLVGSFKSLESD